MLRMMRVSRQIPFRACMPAFSALGVGVASICNRRRARQKKGDNMSNDLSNEELEQRIEELCKAGMVLAAKALEREKSYRAKRAA
jgi:hypothetical protein